MDGDGNEVDMSALLAPLAAPCHCIPVAAAAPNELPIRAVAVPLVATELSLPSPTPKRRSGIDCK